MEAKRGDFVGSIMMPALRKNISHWRATSALHALNEADVEVGFGFSVENGD
jgi:hypothetical protein